MCLAIPLEVKEIRENWALVEYEGTRREVRLDIVDQRPEVGDYVIIHAGFALHRIDEDEAKISLGYWKEILSHAP
ncbi:MAG TPA: HypC/HybG/HupF family hydrogenase formation chaperone, partial [Thermodesulfobacteriota bacterium]|nr:HypC/HybG/HupF family hydrogenase formation chaperone [Thermodesulfobacteriota bacterium]